MESFDPADSSEGTWFHAIGEMGFLGFRYLIEKDVFLMCGKTREVFECESEVKGRENARLILNIRTEDWKEFNGLFERLRAGEPSVSMKYVSAEESGTIYQLNLSVLERDEEEDPVTYAGIIQELGEKDRLKYEQLISSDIVDAMDDMFRLIKAGSWSFRFDEEGGLKSYHCSEGIRQMSCYTDLSDFPADYDRILENIHPSDRERVLFNFKEAAGDVSGKKIFKQELRIKSSDGGWVWIQCAGRFVRDVKGNPMTMYGIMQDIDSQKMNDSAVMEQLLMLQALSRDYVDVFYVDLEKDLSTTLKNSGRILMQSERKSRPYYSTWENYVKRFIDRKEAAALLKKVSAENVMRELELKKEYILDYKVHVDNAVHSFQASFYEIDSPDRARMIILGFRNVDDIVQSEQKRTRELQEMTENLLAAEETLKRQSRIVDALSKDFNNIYVVDLKSNMAYAEKLNGYMINELSLQVKRVFNYYEMCCSYIKARVYSKDRDMMMQYMKPEVVAANIEKDAQYIHNYRILDNGEVHYYQFKFVKLSETGLVVAAFHNIDAVNFRETQMREEMQDNLSIIQAATNVFFSVFYLDFNHNSFRTIKNIPQIAALLDDKEKDLEGALKVVLTLIADESKNEMSRFLCVDYWKESLRTKPFVTLEYRGIVSGWSRMTAIASDRDDEGNVTHILLGLEDINEQKQNQLRQQTLLQNALEAAQHSNRAKTVFLNNMSHDIRTPMNAIIGFTNLAQNHLENKEQIKDYLSKIDISSKHLLSLINDILDMSRIESGKVRIEEQEVHLPDLFNAINTMLMNDVAKKNLNFTMDCSSVVNEDVVCDKLRLNQVLINILSNAVKYTPEGGSIKMTVTEENDAPAGFAAFRFTVKDTGIGMSEEFQKHLFESFSREQKAQVTAIQGTGLGMAITKSIVDLMGGKISVKSEEGKGSEFTVSLVLRKGEGKPEKMDKDEAAEDGFAMFTGKHILLAEDNELNREIATEILTQVGFTVESVCDGEEAVAAMKKDGSRYDLILMDIQMPHMNGYDATRRIRDFNRTVPIVAMTANAFEENRKEALEAGMNEHVGKPIDVEELFSKLKVIMQGK